jgi:hypothetical protein
VIVPGQKLNFSKEDLDLLGVEVSEIIGDLESQHQDLMKQIEESWSAHEAEKLVEKKDFPWVGASNVMIPLIMIHANATLARYLTMIKAGDKIWAGKSDNEEFVKAGYVLEIPKFLNWAARGHEFDFDTPSTDWIQEIIVCGPGVLTCAWEEKTVDVLVPGGKKPQTVKVRSGPIVEHIPRENCLWDMNYRAWDAPVFVRRSNLTWSDIVSRVNENGWDWKVVKELKGSTITETKGGDDIRKNREERSGSDRSMAPTAYGLYDFREVWIDWPMVSRSKGVDPPDEMEEGDRLSTIVLFMHRDSGKIVHATAKPYFHYENPFFDAYFKKRSGIHSSSGLGKILFDIQEACATFVNQAADAVTKSNCTQGVTSQAKMANVDLAPNKLGYVDDVKEVIVFNQGKNIAPDMALFAQLNVLAERLTGINDPALGRETRMGGHPAPATSTLSLLQEGKKLDLVGIRSIRQAISKLGVYLATLYQQYETDVEKIVRAVGQEDGALVAQWLSPDQQVLGNLELDLAAISETMNPQADQQKYLAIFQITGNFYAMVTQFLQLAGNPQAPKALVMAMTQGLEALQESYKKILESGDIDDVKSFLLDLDQLNRSIFESREATQRAAQESASRGPQGANGGAPGGVGQAIGSGL